MGILLAFLPFAAFAVLSAWAGPLVALVVGAAVAAGLMIRTRMQGGEVKILEAGTFTLFAALALYTGFAGRELGIIGVRLCVDTGLLAIILGSMLVGRPFTLAYAREQVPEEFWTNERFLTTNYAITAAWAVAFAAIVAVEAAMAALPNLSRTLGTAVIVVALLGAVAFTKNRSGPARGRA